MKDFIVNAKTDVYAILGDPIEHSMSPVIHNSSFRRCGMDKVFLAVRCDPDHVDEMMRSLRFMGLKGYVFTMPLKELVFDHLDEIRDEAALTGAINCVQNDNGKLIGYNTDSIGFWTAVRERNTARRPIRKVFVMGMGGFSKAAVAQAALQGVEEIVVANRMGSKMVPGFRAFVERLKEKCPQTEVRLIDWDPELWKAELADVDLVANATPNGLNGKGDLEKQFPYAAAADGCIFFDAIYSPLKTAFLAEAEKCGHAIVNGLDLLAHQGVCSFKIWTGVEVEPALMRGDALEFIENSHK